jgi:hypothetical protein
MVLLAGDATLGTGLAGELYASGSGVIVPGVEAQAL